MSTTEEQEPHFRLLVCRTCSVIEELPSGDEDPGDMLLDIAVERHNHSEFVRGALFNVPKGIWMSPKMKEEVVKFIQGQVGSGLDSFGTGFYETKSQFAEDAMSCYSLHNRPTNDCFDYKSAKKELSPNTERERRAAGLPTKNYQKKVYLCDFCPYKSVVQGKAFKEAGLL